jgi:putative oxidoreductase
MTNSTYPDLAALAIRIGAGGMMLTHGIPKIGRFLAEGPIRFADPFGLGPEISLGLAIFAEVACAILVLVGFKTRLATLPLIITMLVAAFYAHADDPFGKKEPALLFLTLFLSVLLMGPGKYAIDSIKKRHKS